LPYFVQFLTLGQQITKIIKITTTKSDTYVLLKTIPDKSGFGYSEKSNAEYLNANVNYPEIRNNDRKFFASLKVLNTTIKDIVTIAKKNTQSSFVAINLAKLPLPNVDLPNTTENSQSFLTCPN